MRRIRIRQEIVRRFYRNRHKKTGNTRGKCIPPDIPDMDYKTTDAIPGSVFFLLFCTGRRAQGKRRSCAGQRIAGVILLSAALLLPCACKGLPFGGITDAGEYPDTVEISVAPEVREALSAAGLAPPAWTLRRISPGGGFCEERSPDGRFRIRFSGGSIEAVFLIPEFPGGQLPQDAVPAVGALYPFHCGQKNSAVRSFFSGSAVAAVLEADFYRGAAAAAVRDILTANAGGPDGNTQRLIRSFNWTKFDSHLRGGAKSVPCPLLLDGEKFRSAFAARNPSMYWKAASLPRTETQVTVPPGILRTQPETLVLLSLFPSHILRLSPENSAAGTEAVFPVSLPDGHWVFFAPGNGTPAAKNPPRWFAVQTKNGEVTARYTDNGVY